ncbi:MAG: heparinase II/III family protein, partial [Deltaproteobacteria bacterium]
FPDAAQALVQRADRACDGIWDLLGYGEAPLGVLPDWQRDFRSNSRWDENERSSRQPVVRGDGSDVKIPWEISRLQHLPAVALAFRLTGEQRYLELVTDQLTDWIRKNPAGRGANWMCPMDVALRAVSMSWSLELLRPATALPSELKAELYLSLFQHGRFVAGHLEDGGVVVGNHFVANLLGLIWLGSLYPALRGADSWRESARARLVRHLRQQIRDDGGDHESSLPYHRLVAEMIGLVSQILAANGRPSPELTNDFARMAAFSAAVLKPDGSAPQLGDNDGGRAFRLLPRSPNDHRYLISWAALVADDAELAAAAALDPETLLLEGAPAVARHQALSQRGVAPRARRAHAFPDSGVFVARAGNFFVLCAATPVGQGGAGGHGHNDKLAIEVFAGRDLVVDPGSFVYTADPLLRNRFRGTAAHATVQLDGLEQNPVSRSDLFFLPERAFARVRRFDETAAGWTFEAEHRGYHPFLHRRRVEIDLVTRALTIDDEILGPGLGEHSATVSFPLAPGIEAKSEGERVTLLRGGVPVGELLFPAPGAGRLRLERGLFSETYGHKTECVVVRLEQRARLPLRLRSQLRTF